MAKNFNQTNVEELVGYHLYLNKYLKDSVSLFAKHKNNRGKLDRIFGAEGATVLLKLDNYLEDCKSPAAPGQKTIEEAINEEVYQKTEKELLEKLAALDIKKNQTEKWGNVKDAILSNPNIDWSTIIAAYQDKFATYDAAKGNVMLGFGSTLGAESSHIIANINQVTQKGNARNAATNAKIWKSVSMGSIGVAAVALGLLIGANVEIADLKTQGINTNDSAFVEYYTNEFAELNDFSALFDKLKVDGISADEKAQLEGKIAEYGKTDNLQKYGHSTTAQMQLKLDGALAQQTIDALNLKYADIDAQIAAKEAEIADLKAQNSGKDTQISDLGAQVAAKDAEIQSLKANIIALEAQIEVLKDALNNSGSDATLVAQIEELTKKVASLETKVASLESLNNSLKDENANLKDENSKLEDANASLSSQVSSLTGTVSGLQSEIAGLNKDIATLTDKNGVLTSERDNALALNAEYAKQIQEANSKYDTLLASYNQKVADYNKLVGDYEALEKAYEEALKANDQTELNNLKAQIAAKEAEITKLSGELSAAEAALSETEKALSAAEAEVEKLTNQLANGNMSYMRDLYYKLTGKDASSMTDKQILDEISNMFDIEFDYNGGAMGDEGSAPER